MERSSDWLWFIDDAIGHGTLAFESDSAGRTRRPAAHPVVGEAVSLHVRGASEAALRIMQDAITAGDTDALLVAGQIHFEMGRYDDAASDFQKLVQWSPTSRVANFNHGLALAKTGRWSAAIESLQRAAVRDPERFEIWLTLGLCLLNEQRGEEAATCFKQVLTLRPEYVLGLLGQAAAQFLTGNHRGALNIYQRLLEAQPERWQLMVNALAAATALGDTEMMVDLSHRILRIQPEHVPALTIVAANAIKQEDFESARTWLAGLAEAELQSFDNWFNLACCCERLNELEQAEEAYGRALELCPHAPDALAGRARILTRLRRFVAAKADWELLLAFGTEPAARSEAAVALVEIAFEQDNVAEALRRASDPAVEDAGVFYRVAWRCHEDGLIDEAAGFYRRTIERDPRSSGAYLNLGRILATRGEDERSRELLMTAIRIDPSLAETYFAFRGDSRCCLSEG